MFFGFFIFILVTAANAQVLKESLFVGTCDTIHMLRQRLHLEPLISYNVAGKMKSVSLSAGCESQIGTAFSECTNISRTQQMVS